MGVKESVSSTTMVPVELEEAPLDPEEVPEVTLETRAFTTPPLGDLLLVRLDGSAGLDTLPRDCTGAMRAAKGNLLLQTPILGPKYQATDENLTFTGLRVNGHFILTWFVPLGSSWAHGKFCEPVNTLSTTKPPETVQLILQDVHQGLAGLFPNKGHLVHDPFGISATGVRITIPSLLEGVEEITNAFLGGRLCNFLFLFQPTKKANIRRGSGTRIWSIQIVDWLHEQYIVLSSTQCETKLA